jgi:HAD superfamily hydrolase (TIGR01509 family)
MIMAVIFDFFDVIRTDAYKSWLATNNIPREGPYFDASYQQDIGNITVEQFLQRLSDLQGRLVTREELDANAKVDYEVLKIIKGLRKNYKIALLSNAPSSIIREILAEHSLEQYFDEIVVSSEVGMVKPSKDIFTYTLRRLKVDASEAIFVDDNEKHTQMAEILGIQSIHFHTAKQLKDTLSSKLKESS